MNTKPRALLRLPAIGALWLLLAALIPLATLSHWLSGHGLSAAEWVRSKLQELWGRV